jgi:hypothetical protein
MVLFCNQKGVHPNRPLRGVHARGRMELRTPTLPRGRNAAYGSSSRIKKRSRPKL